MSGENARILYLKSVGSGDDPQIIPPLYPHGYIAIDSTNGKTLFTIDTVDAVLSPSRTRLYSVQPNEIVIFDTTTGQHIKSISREPDLFSEITNSKILKRSISSDEKLLYEVHHRTTQPLVFQSMNLNSGSMLKPISIDDDCVMVVAHVANVFDMVYFRCGRNIKYMDVYDPILRVLNLPSHALLTLSPDQQKLYSMFDGKLSSYDNKTQSLITSLILLKNQSDGPQHQRLLISRDGTKLVIMSHLYEKLDRGETGVYKSQGIVACEVIDLTHNRHMNLFTYEGHFTAFELTYDGAILYATTLQRYANSIDSVLVKIDVLTGQLISRRTYFDSVITELFLI